MQRIKEEAGKLLKLVREYPITTASITVATITFLLIRRYHSKFLVHPNHQGRHTFENIEGFRHPRERGLESQEIEISTDGGLKLRGWYIKHPKPSQILIQFHSNKGNIGKRLAFLQLLLKNTNSNILIVSYRGFSDSDGNSKPNESQIFRDAINIFRKGIELAERQKLPLFVFGRSLGGAVAIHVLSRPEFEESAKGLILENTFTKLSQVAPNLVPAIFFPVKWIVRFATSKHYHSIEKMKNVHAPVLFIKGKKDEIVPNRMMDELKAVCQQFKRDHFSFEVEEGAHTDTWRKGGQQYFDNIVNFMNHCLRA